MPSVVLIHRHPRHYCHHSACCSCTTKEIGCFCWGKYFPINDRTPFFVRRKTILNFCFSNIILVRQQQVSPTINFLCHKMLACQGPCGPRDSHLQKGLRSGNRLRPPLGLVQAGEKRETTPALTLHFSVKCSQKCAFRQNSKNSELLTPLC